MADAYDVAVVGATGAVGEAMLEMLEQREFPVGRLFALGSEGSAGKRVAFRDKNLSVGDAASFDFARVQIALFAAGARISQALAERAAAAGCAVIDTSGFFADAHDVPLVVPEVNAEAIADHAARGMIASPSATSIALAMALKPIHDFADVVRVNVATYQAVSASGTAALRELADQTARLLNGQAIREPTVYPRQIAFNTLPLIDGLQDNGYSDEEMRLIAQTRRLLGQPDLPINPTAVRVPVFFGHGQAVHVETREGVSAKKARQLLTQAPGMMVVDTPAPDGYATPVTEAANQDEVFVSRIRQDISCENGLNFWIVADNIRKGAALNSVQIAEKLIEKYI
ncbi:aspartate-semialdehyde dehydrogenase [Salinisphaera sp. S4-8]|uniref:aspartate-semialdehyde dehydrogenase n=1 Tax=Salinisphaera sp. S4-8 TaxID=633357 RepID=UPI003342AB9D